jgi:transposase
MKTQMKMVLFTDETRATLDGPDGWGKGWVGKGQERHIRFRRQQGGGGVMIWAGMIEYELIVPVRVPDGVKITSAAYCQLLESALLPWLEDETLQKRRRLIFQHDNAPSHSAKATQAFLSSIRFKGDRLMVWPPWAPDLNPIENLWGILKQDIFKGGKQYTSKEDLWKAIETSASSIHRSEIKKFTESVNKRIVIVFQKKGSSVKY